MLRNAVGMKIFKLPTILLGATLLIACASDKDAEEAYVERPVHELYNQATNALEKRDFNEAASLFDEVERQHPYSLWATKAQLMAGYAYYEANRYGDALVTINRFIQLHPGNKDIPYAYYLRALSYYEQISDVSRDQGVTQKALTSLICSTSKRARSIRSVRSETFSGVSDRA